MKYAKVVPIVTARAMIWHKCFLKKRLHVFGAVFFVSARIVRAGFCSAKTAVEGGIVCG